MEHQVLFWSQAQRDANFRRTQEIFPSVAVKAGRRVRALPRGAPLPVARDEVDRFIAAQNVAGLIVLQDGKVRLERYARGFSSSQRWTAYDPASPVGAGDLAVEPRQRGTRGPVAQHQPREQHPLEHAEAEPRAAACLRYRREVLEGLRSLVMEGWELETMRAEWWYAFRLPVNWKLAEEAFMEQYHVIEAHEIHDLVAAQHHEGARQGGAAVIG